MKKYLLIIVTLIFMVNNVKAANTYKLISEGYSLKNGLAMNRIMVNNDIGFCIQPGVPEGTVNYKQKEFEKEYQKLSLNVKKEIQKIGLYTKYYYDTTKKKNYYYAGQELIWTLLGNKDFIFAQNLTKEKNDIKKGINDFEKLSKYANQSFKIKGGDTLELKDDFSEFEISNQSDFEKKTGLKITLSKDKLIIKNPVNNLINKKVSLDFIKFKKKFNKGVSYAHYNSVYQDYVSVKDNFNIKMNINFEAEVALGGFKGNKVDEDNKPLSDVQFTLYQDSKVIQKFKSDEKGNFQINNLQPGEYFIQESNTYDYLILDNKKYEFAIQPKQIISINNDKPIINNFKKGRIIFNKHGKLLNEDSKPLKDVIFGIYDENKNLLYEVASNEQGMLVSDCLRYGKYYLKEIKSIDDYLIDEEFYEFEINSEEDLIFNEGKPFINKAKEYLLKIKKVDGDSKKPLEKVSFNIKGKNYEKEFSTDENGEININLNKGCYIVKEIKALDGYIHNQDEKEVCLEKDEEFEFLNYQYFQVDTGSKKPNSFVIIIAFGSFSLFLIARLIYKKIKQQKR